MNYQPFRVDPEILGVIYEKSGKELSEIIPVAFGEQILNKGIEEVTEEEIEIFVDYQRTLQIVNQFFGAIPVQPDDFDIRALVVQTLQNNSLKKRKQEILIESNKEVQKDGVPIRLGYVSRHFRNLARAVLHKYVIGELHFSSTDDLLQCLNTIEEKGKIL